MNPDVTRLFQPLAVGTKILRNRLVMPPMVVNRGLNTEESAVWYGQRARGGVGLVIVEATDVSRFGSDLTANSLRPLAEIIHDGGALAAVQLFPGARLRPTSPEQLGLDEVETLIEGFQRAAEVCAGAGFDGIEVHGAHGYLLNQFFSPTQNRRSDHYAVSLENRMRLALRIIEAVKPTCVETGMLLLYRHTPAGPGYGIADSLELARRLVASGVDVLDISPASDVSPADLAAPFVPHGVPVIAVNGMDQVDRAVTVLEQGLAQLVAVGRGLIADPDWPAKVREGRLDEIVACIACDRCHDDLRAGVPVGCSQWG
ncbi:MAG: oxidoreductase [Anaerolineae bacterium]